MIFHLLKSIKYDLFREEILDSEVDSANQLKFESL